MPTFQHCFQESTQLHLWSLYATRQGGRTMTELQGVQVLVTLQTEQTQGAESPVRPSLWLA